jgi:leucyl aminopeptidase
MLDIQWTTDDPGPADGRLLAVPLRNDHDIRELDARFGPAAGKLLKAARYKGKPGEIASWTRERNGVLERVSFIGVGEGFKSSAEIRVFGHDLVRHAQQHGATSLVIDLHWDQAGAMPWTKDLTAAQVGSLIAQGLELGTYAYERFLSKDNRVPISVATVTIWADTAAGAEGSARGQVVAQSIARARDLGNGPAELVTPSFLAKTAEEIVASLRNAHDVEITVLDREDCEARKMGCYLGVAKGSDEPCKFIHMHYTPRGESAGRIALIGKGVTFDSGGYSLKPTDGMLDMKLDMAGAAAVISAFEGAVKLGVPWEIDVVVAATENMVSGHAYRLGDVLVASNGKSVEINNTDAEGRLTLADAMVYSAALEPDLMIDFATLTGACMIALGPKIAGVMTHDDRLAEDWLDAAKRSGESMWRLPLPDDLKEQMASKVADMKNTGERYGGAITAGLFLSEFSEGRRWMHVDLAGPAMASKAYGLTTPGGTGFAVATILEFLSGNVRL